MIVAIDTNILIDIIEPDPIYGPASRDAVKRCLQEGAIVSCEVVWAEVTTAYYDQVEKLHDILAALCIEFSPMSAEASREAAKRWHAYRRKGGTRTRIAADFLIGGHALIQCDRLLTRDRGFYRDYFNPLHIIDPMKNATS